MLRLARHALAGAPRRTGPPRYYSDRGPPRPFLPFGQWVQRRRTEAQRSLVVQVRSDKSAADLHAYCHRELGPVRALHFLRTRNPAFANFYLVEFESDAGVQSALSHCHHRRNGEDATPVPIYSPFVWFMGQSEPGPVPAELDLPPIHHHPTPDAPTVKAMYLTQPTLDRQIQALYEASVMNDTSTRVRFLACQQLELAIRGLFPQGQVLPFGSSVNSYGSNTSDLDMVVKLDKDFDNVQSEDTSRLIFHAKGGAEGVYRTQSQRYCQTFGNLIQCFLPGCQEVLSVLRARVPIVKYKQELLGLDCDLSFGSMSGYYMSELLYMYGELDPRVRPLIYTVRRWAKLNGITLDPRPTPALTNFSLTLMVIYFLMYKHHMLPSFRTLYKLARPEEKVVCDDNVVCTFLRDLSGHEADLNACLNNTSLSLSDLLMDFFKFYADFNFDRHAICVLTGDLRTKRSNNGHMRHLSFFIDITNPLEPDLNVSSNVQSFAVPILQQSCQRAYRVMMEIQEGRVEPRLDLVIEDVAKTAKKLKIKDLVNWEEKITFSSDPPEDISQKKTGYSEQKQKQLQSRGSRLIYNAYAESFKPKF